MGVGGREAQEGEDICIHIADSCCIPQKLTQHRKPIICQLKNLFPLELGWTFVTTLSNRIAMEGAI